MHVLAIDTATRRVGAAIGTARGLLGAVEIGGPGAPGPPRHAESLAPAIARLVEDTGIPLDRLAAVAVGVGPGMFTGLRVGVTTAKVLALALGIPVVPVSSLDLVALPLRHGERAVVAVLDARRREVYRAWYRPVPGGLQRTAEADVMTPAELAAEVVACGDEVVLAGDGALRFADELAVLDHVELAGIAHAAPSLGALVELAAARVEREEFVRPDEVAPCYVRRSDAEERNAPALGRGPAASA